MLLSADTAVVIASNKTKRDDRFIFFCIISNNQTQSQNLKNKNNIKYIVTKLFLLLKT